MSIRNEGIFAFVAVAWFLFACAFLTGRADSDAAQGLPAGVASSAQQTRPLEVGASLPAHLRPATVDGKAFDLDRAVHSKPTVLIFYRGGWCPFCNMQMGQLEEVEPQLSALGYQILAISADNPVHLRESVANHHLTYALLSDTNMAASRAFGLAFRVDDTTVEKYKTYGIDLEAASGRTDHILPVPAAYVLDRRGVIHFAYANPDYRVRVNPDDLLRAAKKALQ